MLKILKISKGKSPWKRKMEMLRLTLHKKFLKNKKIIFLNQFLRDVLICESSEKE